MRRHLVALLAVVGVLISTRSALADACVVPYYGGPGSRVAVRASFTGIAANPFIYTAARFGNPYNYTYPYVNSYGWPRPVYYPPTYPIYPPVNPYLPGYPIGGFGYPFNTFLGLRFGY